MQPTEPESTHAPDAHHTVSVDQDFAGKPRDANKMEVPLVAVVPGDPVTAHQVDVLKGGHDRPDQQPVAVPNTDIEKGTSTFSRPVSLHSLWEHVRTLSIAPEDEGKGYDDWLKLPKLEHRQVPLAIVKHSATQLIYVLVISIPAVLFAYLFSLLVKEAVQEWRRAGHQPLQKDPIIAGLIGEPFHHLSPGLLYGTFIALSAICPFLCCQTKMLIHPLYMYGRQLIPLWKISILSGSIMATLSIVAAITMHMGQLHVPRIVWMGVVFVGLFGGTFFCSRKAAQILGFPGFTLLFFRATFVANVLLYLYAVFFPFWFFGTTSVAAKLFLAIGFHPMVEFGVAFLWQHTAVYLRHNDPSTSIFPGFHYSCLFALYGAFLLVNFAELWQNILGFTMLRLWTILCKVYAQELTYCTYRTVLRKTPEEAAAILSSVRFKRYRNDVINSAAIVESVTIITAGAVTVLFKFNKSPDGEPPSTTSLAETALLVGGQVVIGIVCDAVADAGLTYRGSPWNQAWQTKQKHTIYKFCQIVFVSVGMFLFYFYPFLASKMVLDP